MIAPFAVSTVDRNTWRVDATRVSNMHAAVPYSKSQTRRSRWLVSALSGRERGVDGGLRDPSPWPSSPELESFEAVNLCSVDLSEICRSSRFLTNNDQTRVFGSRGKDKIISRTGTWHT